LLHTLACLVIAGLAAFGVDRPLQTTVFERDPVSGERRPLAGVQVAFLEAPAATAATPKQVRVMIRADGKHVALVPPRIETTDAEGRCGFESSERHSQWAQTSGQLLCFKPGHVPRKLDAQDCQGGAGIELVRGHTARLRIHAPAGVQSGAALAASVQFSVYDSMLRVELGKVPMQLEWTRGEDGRARFDLELGGFEHPDSNAVLRVEGFDALRIGPASPEEIVLRPQRCLELRVCDWESGAPIEGVKPTLRFGVLDEAGFFRPCPKYAFDQRPARRDRDELLREPGGVARQWCSSTLLLPDEAAAQITNLAHGDYFPTIYLSQRGKACPDPLTILAPDSGSGVCTLYLRRWKPGATAGNDRR